jgi:hypothetical protein
MTTDQFIHCVYVAASRRDSRFTRICVASIRYFYPDIPISLLAGGPLQPGLAVELRRYWNVAVKDLPVRDWGWGFVKLEPLFGQRGERFLVVDSDTVCVGDVLKIWADCNADFLVDDEWQSQRDTERLYYDWQKVAHIDVSARSPKFVFNSGQWFGTAGIFSREDFSPWIDWNTEPPYLRHADVFMPGDQGVLNYVFNQKYQLEQKNIARSKLMRWPRHGMHGITPGAIAASEAPRLIVHWAGLKRATIGSMPGADVLLFFERLYYGRIPRGSLRRRFRAVRYSMTVVKDDLVVRMKLRLRKVLRQLHLSRCGGQEAGHDVVATNV